MPFEPQLKPDAPVDPFQGVVAKVFLSSTIEDLKSLRQQVRNAASEHAKTHCWLSDEASATHEVVENYCRRELRGSLGYILLLGHWYGSVPPGEPAGRSITHLEYSWAFERWRGDPGQAMAVMMPEVGSAIDIELHQAAQRIVGQRQLDAGGHAQLLKGFVDEVAGLRVQWRYVARFDSVAYLRELAIASCRSFREGLLIHAARNAAQVGLREAAPAVHELGESDLGRLGRSSQIDAMRRALAELKAGPHPALAVLVHGDPQAGHRVFIAHLAAAVLGAYRPRQRISQLPTGFAGVPALCAWIAQALSLPPGTDSPQGLAERCHAALAQRPLALVIDRIRQFEGGVAAFHAQLWRPLCAALAACVAAAGGRPGPHRLLLIVATYAADRSAWETLARDTGDDDESHADGSLLWPLPVLGAFNARQLERWFDDVGVAEDPASRQALRDRLFTDEDGQPDTVPLRVLDRLRGELESGGVPLAATDQEPAR